MDKTSTVLGFLSILLIFLVSVVNSDMISSCNQTPYPEICNSFITTNNINNLNIPLRTLEKPRFMFRDVALQVTLNQAERAHQLISAMDLGSFDERGKTAWADCLELAEDTITHLNRSMTPSDPNSLKDSQTWLSAAIANQETCKNGFIELNSSSHLTSLPFMLSNFSKLLSNSLAINYNQMETNMFSKSTGGGNRRLLSVDGRFPRWISTVDRKLLQSSTTSATVDLVVAQDGTSNYKTITEAVVASVKLRGGGSSNNKRFVIHVKAGVYKENIEIKKSMKNLMIIGDGIDKTIVTGSKNVVDGSTTFRSATFAVTGDGFIARDMTFENTAGPQKHQAVAFRSGSDHSVFYRCSFKGYQDTLYVYAQRQFYRDCDVYGTVDFIFGDAAAILQNCNIYVRKPMSNQINTITAQGRVDPNEITGISIHNSRVTAASDLKPVQGSFKTYLGRPWKQYSRTVFMKTYLDSLIDPAGWLEWSGNFALNTLYYGEYMNTGGGAGTRGRVKWPGFHVITSVAEAAKLTVGNFLAGSSWIPNTVPFNLGL